MSPYRAPWFEEPPLPRRRGWAMALSALAGILAGMVSLTLVEDCHEPPAGPTTASCQDQAVLLSSDAYSAWTCSRADHVGRLAADGKTFLCPCAREAGGP